MAHDVCFLSYALFNLLQHCMLYITIQCYARILLLQLSHGAK